MTARIHETESFAARVDHTGAYVKCMIWEKARRAPVTIEVYISAAEVQRLHAGVHAAIDDVEQRRLW